MHATHTGVRHSSLALLRRVPLQRLRLPPPPVPPKWVPRLGEAVEGLWNDCWWSGSVIEMHVFKGLLFEYEKVAAPIGHRTYRPALCSAPLR